MSPDTVQDLTGVGKPVRPCQRTLVLGLGNPILRDDGVGWRVVEALSVPLRSLPWTQARAGYEDWLEFDCVSLGGLALMERMVGYERVVLVDAIQTASGAAGTVYRLALDDLPTLHANAAHDATLKEALALGHRLGVALPASDEIAIIAVEAADVLDFGENLSPAVEAAVPEATQLVLKTLKLNREE
jgi:hydrogenase maturation protease